jgi:ribosomal protein L37AE/L43A
MEGFKPKTSKVIQVDKRYTSSIDTKHKEMMADFKNKTKQELPRLIEQQRNLAQQVSILKSSLNEYIDYDTLDEYQKSTEDLEKITAKINLMKKKEKEYLLEHSKNLFDYYENRQENNDDSTQKTILMSFFKQTPKLDEIKENPMTYEYLSKVDDNFIDLDKHTTHPDQCEKCGSETVSIHTEGILVCRGCGVQYDEITENEATSYKEPPKEISSYAYKRKNHFKEILAQFQGKETTDIKPQVLDNIKRQIKKDRIDLSQLTNDKMKGILKKLGYNKYYEHITYIKSQLGIKPPIMTEELEEKLCNMFDEIQTPYSKYCPADRVNFLNYYGVLYKMCELLGEDDYLEHFYMLKDRVKRMEQDEIWKKICHDLKWEFIPSV